MQDDDRFGVSAAVLSSVIRHHAERGIDRTGTYVPTRAEVQSMEIARLHSILSDWFFECPSELIPTDEQVLEVKEALLARVDRDKCLASVALCEEFLGSN